MAVYKEIAKADGSGVTTFYRLSDVHDTVEVDESESEAVVFDYNQAQNKPSINNVALVGNKTSEDLGLQPAGDYLTNDEADDKFVDNDELEAKNYVNQAQLAEAIASISHFHREIVDGLPVQGEDNVIYLVRKTGKQGDIYDEYLWVGLAYSSTGYEYLGSTAADLSNYITRDNLNASLATKVDKREGFGLSSNDYTSAEKTKLAGLSNYDDSELRTAVEALHNYDDTEIKADISGLEDDIDAITLDMQNLSDSNSYKITSIRLIKNGDNWSWQNVKGDVLSFDVAQEALGHEDTILVVEDIENDGKYSPIFYRSYNNYILICFENEGKEVFLVNMGTTNSYSRLGKNVKYRGITTSSPVSGNEGDIIIDRDSKLVYIYDGTNWVPFDKGGEVDLSNYLAKDNTTAWIPTGDFNPATKKYVDDSISGIYIPTKTSQLTNDSNFITKNVNNLTNYYLKTNIYTKAEVDALIQGGGGTSDYATLSNKPQINSIELSGNKSLSDLGLMSANDINTSLGLKADKSTTYTKTQVDTAINTAVADKADASTVNAALEGKADKSTTYTKNEVDSLVSAKADNMTFSNNVLQLKSGTTNIGNPVTIQVATNDVAIQDTEPSSADTKLWIDTSEDDDVLTVPSEVVNTLDGNENDKAPCVRAINEALVETYSTDEVKTNKVWIDGKPIYRKTFVKENATTGNNEISLSDLDYDYIVIKESSFIRSDFTFSPNRYKASLADDVVEAFINNNSKNLIVNVGSFWNNINCYVTLEYTKTTD